MDQADSPSMAGFQDFGNKKRGNQHQCGYPGTSHAFAATGSAG
jgi:hypothetical protein